MGNWQYQENDSKMLPGVEQVPGAFRRVLADGDRMMVIEWTMSAGVAVPLHNHPHEQSGYVVSGEMIFSTGGVEHSIKPGMGYAVAGNVPHGARFPVPSIVVDIFSPPREDYRGAAASAYSLTPAAPVRAPKARAAKRSAARKPAAKKRALKAKKR